MDWRPSFSLLFSVVENNSFLVPTNQSKMNLSAVFSEIYLLLGENKCSNEANKRLKGKRLCCQYPIMHSVAKMSRDTPFYSFLCITAKCLHCSL